MENKSDHVVVSVRHANAETHHIEFPLSVTLAEVLEALANGSYDETFSVSPKKN